MWIDIANEYIDLFEFGCGMSVECERTHIFPSTYFVDWTLIFRYMSDYDFLSLSLFFF